MNIIIVYYSWSGNTKRIAELIKAETGGTVFGVKPKAAYPKSFNATADQAKKEIESGYKPELESDIETAGFDTVFIGSPNWWGTVAPPMAAFLAGRGLSGKTVVPFCSHGGGGEQRVLKDIVNMCPGSKALEGFCVYGDGGAGAEGLVSEWLTKAGIR
jgi:flavodoxin